MGGFNFSSTMTFVKCDGKHYAVFAAHAIENEEFGFDRIFIMTSDSNFVALSGLTESYKIFHSHDLVVCRLKHQIENRQSFNIANSVSERNGFNWIGFPKKKAIEHYHKSKVKADAVPDQLVNVDGDIDMFVNAKYLVIGSKFHSRSETEIVGKFSLKNATYQIDGYKEKGYSPRGMSGGALFCIVKPLYEGGHGYNAFFFVGIGLEYSEKTEILKGATRDIVASLIAELE
jgi:hypothetical protein